jgi:hypothetical protein
MKDPLALFSSEWLATRYNMRVVVIIRHPAAFVSSIKRAGWKHPYGHFLVQRNLMDNELKHFESEIRTAAEQGLDPISDAVLLWRVIQYYIQDLRARQPEWLFIRHEDISFNPAYWFRRLFNCLDITGFEQVLPTILSHSSEDNPDLARRLQDLRVNSRANIWAWKTRLSEEEVSLIRERTHDIWPLFYSEEDW